MLTGGVQIKEGDTKTLTIPSELDLIRDVADFAESGARSAGFSDETVEDWTIAVTEAVNNAIIHGNKSEPSKQVKISLTLAVESLTAQVCDAGNGFDPQRVEDPRTPSNRLKDSGRGILIIRKLVDDVRFERIEGGSCVTMTMFRHADA